MFKLYVTAALAVIVTVPLSVAASFYMGEQRGMYQANSQCIGLLARIGR